MTNPICTLSAQQLLLAFEKKELSPAEVMEAILSQAEAMNPSLNALFGDNPESAMTQARASEQRWQKNRPQGSLDGLPITVKDSIKTIGFPSWHGCRANMQKPLDKEDAPPAARLKEAGAIIFAKTAMPDIGMLACGVSSAHGIVRNAWNTDFNPGGSSAGAATAVAAGIGPCSIGTDGGGSVRIPAAHCGLFGFKPTNGRIPHTPPDPIRTAGPLTRNVADSALLMNVLSQPDSRDFGSLPPLNVDYLANLERNLKGLKLGFL
ncbi:MAG: amidase family protein, partial [bacterium]